MTNQLVDTADAVPDFDEYAHLTTQEIACAVQYAKPDSEEMYRAVAAISARAPGIGHNKAPLAEALEDELQPLKVKADELVELAEGAIIIDDDSAAKVTDLLQLLKGLEEEADKARLSRTKPYRDGQKMINDAYHRVTMPLVLARGGTTGKAGLIGMLTAHDDNRKARIEAERQTALAEQRKREEEAAAAQRRAEEATAQGRGGASAQLDMLAAREEAERAAARAAALRPAPIRSHLGTVNRRREIKVQISEPLKFAGWLLEQPTYRNHVLQALQTIAGQVTRAAGVEGVGKGLDIPGLSARVEQGAASVRR